MNWQTEAAARVPRLKPGATCDRRSAAKTVARISGTPRVRLLTRPS